MSKHIKISKFILLIASAGYASCAFSQSAVSYVTVPVVSSVPNVVQVATTQTKCYTENRQVSRGGTGAGAVMGAIAGGVIGNSIGKGAGNALATGLGIFGGAVVGNNIEGGRRVDTDQVQKCGDQTVYEPQIQGYLVTYEFMGQRQSVKLQRNPGPTITLQVSVAPVVEVN